jgi:hypothetical protein
VPPALADGLRVHAGAQVKRGVGVPQVVQPDCRRYGVLELPGRRGQLPGELPGQPLGVTQTAVEPTEDVGVVPGQGQRQRPPLGAVRTQCASVRPSRSITRDLPDFGGPTSKRSPSPSALTSTAERRTVRVPASKSTSPQRTASASPRRIPVMASSSHAGYSSGRSRSVQSRKVRSWSASQVCISGDLASFAVGGLAFAAGLTAMRLSTAAARALCMIVWM